MKVFCLCKHIYSRQAKQAPRMWNIAKTITQALSLWTVFLLVVPLILVQVELASPLARLHFSGIAYQFAGMTIFGLCGAIGLWCGVLLASFGNGTPLPFDSTTRLVIKGPYRYVRNPMALVSFAQGAGVGLALGSPLVILYALAGCIYWNYMLRPWEELDLEQRFGNDFIHYRNSVRCWLPALKPYQAQH
ncbi:MAG: isoprenylcysteine carboxylmethyltransferase family protein [Candidatus Obscuribacterales bacterium]|nr:isoprenylcysteine carboxylmethyltransferase family protein [Candidatus Obscuribacterales bacterium]